MFCYDLLMLWLDRFGLVLTADLLSRHVQLKVMSRRPWKAEQSQIQQTSAAAAAAGSQQQQHAAAAAVNTGEVRWGCLPEVAAIQSAARAELTVRLKEEQQQAARDEEADRRKRGEDDGKMETDDDTAAGRGGGGAAAAAAPSLQAEEDADSKRRRGKRGSSRRWRRVGRERERGGGRRSLGLDEDAAKVASEQIAVFKQQLQHSAVELPAVKEEQRLQSIRDLVHRVSLASSSSSSPSLPSVCCFTFLNSASSLTSAALSGDGSLAIGGFADSAIRVWDMYGKDDEEEQQDDVPDLSSAFPRPSHRPLPSVSSTSSCVSLIGHSGPVYGCSLSPDSSFLLSGSEDSSIRLWDLPTGRNLVAYRGHSFPVWDVAFSPLGYHFASAAQSAQRTAAAASAQLPRAH